MNKLLSKIVLFSCLLVFTTISFAPDANALHRSRNTQYSSKIKKLDEDRVKNLPVPILFGVTIKNIWPNFGDARGGGTRSHEGLDIMAPEGAPIVSPTEAVVIDTGNAEGSGKYVRTANPGGESFVYMHLSEILVRSGAELDAGDIIGLVGNTGNASGGAPHLHFEIRENREAFDPFLRIKTEFLLKDKIESLEDALEEVDDEDEFIEFIVQNYKSELWQAKALGIELPEEIEEMLPVATVPAGGTVATPPGDLTLGSNGPLVTLVQSLLIAKDSGLAARALAAAGATGYFGPITQRAVIEYQMALGISPANGYFGPKTLAAMLSR